MKAIKTFIAILMLFCGHWGYAQQKGSFSAFVHFMDDDRVLSCYVPLNYDSTQQYRLMIGLHGAGDNSSNYRNVLINTLGWPNIFANTIFIFPDGGGDQVKDFSSPAGDEGIIEEAIRFAIQNYSIDSTNILLQGFSLGGRTALKYGLDHTSRFKALLLNTPAVQSIQDAKNVPGPSLIYDYAKASQIPIYITCGMLDEGYSDVLSRVVVMLKENNAKLDYMPVPGLGHGIPNGTVTVTALNFIMNPKRSDYDVDLFKLEAKDRYCSDINAKCKIRNTGSAAITSLKLTIQYGNVNTTLAWNGNLNIFEHAEITLPVIAATDGTGSLNISIAEVNSSQTDPVVSNNNISKEVQVVTTTNISMVNEGFEADELQSWNIEDNGCPLNWTLDNSVSKKGAQSISNFNSALIFNSTGLESNLSTPFINLSAVTAPTLSFDLAFNYHKYTPPYLPKDTIFADTLEVLISVDCGNSFQRLYKKGGAQLTTASEPIVNALSLGDAIFSPAQNEWRMEVIDLKPFIGAQSAFIMFKYISGYGGSIYLDNARIGEGLPAGIEEQKQDLNFTMYPNPASEMVTIAVSDPQQTKVTIYDSLGKTVSNEYEIAPSTKQLSIDLTGLENGFYMIEMNNGAQKSVKKLLVNR